MNNKSFPRDSFKPTSACSPQVLWQRQDWMMGLNNQIWLERTGQRQLELQHWIDREQYPRILLVQTDPLEFLAGFMAACLCDCPVFLGNPHWQRSEWQQVLHLANPQIIWGVSQLPKIDIPEPTPTQPKEKGWILIPTGGSSGQIRFAIHTWSTLAASVKGCQRHFFGNQPDAIHSCCWLPLYHVSGLMQFMRSLLTDGQFILLPKHCFSTHPPLVPDIAAFLDSESKQPQQYFLSLVPTQLQRLLQQSDARLQWLARFRTILVGGAPAWPSLLKTARQHQLRLALTYGMTETASQVATLDPNQFLLGAIHNGPVLPHAQITIRDDQLKPVTANTIGQVVIQSDSLCKGYYPQRFASSHQFLTDDIGYFNDYEELHIVGRLSRKIISGGENIFPEEIESVLLGTGMVKDVMVFGEPHPDWGQSITALVVPLSPHFSLPALKSMLANQLSAFKQPQQWHVLPELPRNPQGKIDPAQTRTAVQFPQSEG
ncbi:2-succinylbenzoate--CoA ligase [Acaryochloris sp. IP29b_bin.137]|uniref:2-succinylbenzoate--CoA ligase n=1 Tax=Acaryochloris sp. IP29b_bin.137 TaxID=2969217 RepID=UPI00261AF311|nr:2-succinylbenzoate--CoA ligase [Acaryochloris sp. IP29b_bin.137]